MLADSKPGLPPDFLEKTEQAKALADAGALRAAERLLAELTAQQNAPLEPVLLYGRVLNRLDRGGDALKLAESAAGRFPQNLGAQCFLCEMLLSFGAVEDAKKHLSAARVAFPEAPQLRALSAQTFLLDEDLNGALQSLREAAKLNPSNMDFRAREAVVLAALGQTAAADDIRHNIEDGNRVMLSVYRDWIFFLQRNRRRALAATLSDNACAIAPSRAEPWLWRAELLLGDQRAEEALAALKNCSRSNEPMNEAIAFRFSRARARALRISLDKDAAIGAFKEALAVRGKDEPTLRDLYVLHLQTGREVEMRDYGRQLSSAGAEKLPATLAAGLSELRGRKPPPSIMDARAQWAWELADKSVWTKDSWLEALYWGQNADELLRDWWLSTFERGSEIGALIDRPVHTALDDLQPGAKCLCAGTHMGPLAAGVYYMQTCGRPFRGFGYAGPDPVVEGEPPMRIAARGNDSLRALMQEIQNGTLIGFAAESPDEGQHLELDFLGRRITLATLVPRLIWKLKTSSIWWQTRWEGERVAIDIQRLPDPESEEPMDAWCRRWADAYLEHVARVMCGHPENLNLGHGIWRNAD